MRSCFFVYAIPSSARHLREAVSLMVIHIFRILIMRSCHTICNLTDFLIASELCTAVQKRQPVCNILVKRIFHIDRIARDTDGTFFGISQN